MATAGIRELRQYLSRYVERAKAGETIEVTERGRVVAALVPRRDVEDEIAALERRGVKLTRATREWQDLGPPPKPQPGRPSASETLEELRARERY